MKKLYLFFALTAFTITLNAQLTQSNHALVAGDNYEMYQCDSLAISPGASGAGAVWNFGTIATHSSIVLSYTTSNNTNTGFPSASVAVAASANNTSYYSSTLSSMLYWGGNIATGGVVGQLTYTTPAVYAAYPMSLNTSTSSTPSGTVSVTSPISANGSFAGDCGSVADGTGTLTLPGANHTFTDVVRIKITQTVNITTSFANATVTQMNYDYYSPAIKGPLFSIVTTTAVTALGTQTQTMVYRNKNAAVTGGSGTGIVANTNNPTEFLVYPNPSSGFIYFTADSKEAKQAVIFDITGKEVDVLIFENGKATLNVSKYQRGIYLYRVLNSSDKTYKTGRITVTE